MMASTSETEKSILKVRLGNLEPKQDVRIEFSLLGKLTSELPNSWTLRIPAHIGPRYESLISQITKIIGKIGLKEEENKGVTSFLGNTEWDFKINLFSSKKIVKASSGSHKLTESIFSNKFRSYSLNEPKVPERPLELTF